MLEINCEAAAAADYSMSHTPSYTELQPVIDLGCLVTPSNDPYFGEEVTCVEYTIYTEDRLTDLPSCCLYTPPDSPKSLIEEECIDHDLLQTALYEESQVYDDEDDDASVMLDFMDLSFLDEEDDCCHEGHEGHRGHRGQDGQTEDGGHCFTDTLENCPTVVVTTVDSTPDLQQFTPHPPSPLTPAPSPSPSSPHSPPSPTTTDASSTTTFTFHYSDLSATITVKDPSNQSLPSSLSDLTHGLAERVSGSRKRKLGEMRGEKAMDFDSFDNSNDDDDDEKDYKPYCDSRRGAKRNLLWKFLLWMLEQHPDVVQWKDVKSGVFKFVDTARVSVMWGQRKRKTDMTFEKLSRGIRHYYKRGLMERLSHTRLMYKFNWDKVPKRYRKA
ncbi:hypothetical protein ACOMHN_010738 [Nucella lapillus]